MVTLCRDGIRRYYKVHRLVCEAFLPNPDNKPTVNHIDENINNNALSNLEWATYKENANHGTRLQRCYANRDYKKIGEHIAKAKRVNGRCRRIIQYDKNMNKIREWEAVADASKELNILPSGIGLVLHGSCPTYKGYIWRYAEQLK